MGETCFFTCCYSEFVVSVVVITTQESIGKEKEDASVTFVVAGVVAVAFTICFVDTQLFAKATLEQNLWLSVSL